MLKNHTLLKQKTCQHVTMKTRLGMIDVNPEHIYTFEEGLYGFSEAKSFVIVPMPGIDDVTPFLLMQSLDDEQLCFVLLNSNLDYGSTVTNVPSLLLQQDIEQVALALNIDIHDIAFSFLVSFQQEGDAKMTINTMAPLFFSLEQKLAWQVLLNNPIYNVKETIG
ncbi:MAG: flagellar assembly protein FliW [Proteobacteria bacterium]|nr:flagellar assembly protein FliW [Pseudomonadota bacterium]